MKNLLNTQSLRRSPNVEGFSSTKVEFDYNAEPIWELAARLTLKISDAEWAKLPKDLAKNFDHYQQQQDS